MNVAIGIGTLLLGGWVLNTPTENLTPDEMDRAPVLQVPLSQPAAPDNAAPMRRPKNQNPERALPRDEVQQRLRNQKEPQAQKAADTRRRDEPGRAKPATQANVQKQPSWVLPPAPTDPLRANSPGMPAMPLPPTVRESDLRPGPIPADPFGSPTSPNVPDIPMSRQAYSPQSANSPSSYTNADRVRQSSEMAEHPVYAPREAATKAFSSARPFSSGVSPYMGIFRNDTAGGTIDNYSTYVRPALDQRSMNQQFNMDIYGLERNQKIQNAALQQMSRGNTRAPQSIGTPQFYMNYGNYYPNYQQGGNGQGLYGQ